MNNIYCNLKLVKYFIVPLFRETIRLHCNVTIENFALK